MLQHVVFRLTVHLFFTLATFRLHETEAAAELKQKFARARGL